ncbi:outer membrane lipoprotein-sorting protein [Bacteroidota bacterium]
MKRKHIKTGILTVLVLAGTGVLNAQYPSGDELMERMDKNMSAKNRVITSKMVIHGPRSSRTIESKSWSVGEEKSYSEYLSPPREAGTKMLKLEEALWIYSPATDRTIQISGHMLRQSVMGSDLSYEDMMDDATYKDNYNAEVLAEETLRDTKCWVIELKATTEDVTYQVRKIWMDQEKYIPLREELYAKSGKLLKKTELYDIKRVQGRWFPGKMVFKDMLKKGEGTEFIIDNIVFDTDIPEHIFTKASLR